MSAVVNNTETNLYNTRGDDFLLYHAPWSGRFLLMPWDQDGAFLKPQESPFVRTVGNMVQGTRLLQRDTLRMSTKWLQRLVHPGPTPADDRRGSPPGACGQCRGSDAEGGATIDRVQHLQAIVNQPWTLEWSDAFEPSVVLIAEGALLWRYFLGQAAPSAEPDGLDQQEFLTMGGRSAVRASATATGTTAPCWKRWRTGTDLSLSVGNSNCPDPEAWRLVVGCGL